MSADGVYFESAAQWREWLNAHHGSATELVVGFVKATTGRPNMSWSEAVDEAICFGWIDGVRRRVDEERYTIRFTPRKSGSTWSRVNVAKVEALLAEGRMQPAGLLAYEKRSAAKTAIYSYERAADSLSPDEEREFRSHAVAWAFFSSLPAGYRRTAIHWVTGAKRDDTRQRRFETLISDSAAGRRLRHLSR